MTFKYSVSAKDAPSTPIDFSAIGFRLNFSGAASSTPKFEPLVITFSPEPGSAALTLLLNAYGRSDPFETLVIEIKDDMNRLRQRVTLSEALIVQVQISSNSGEAISDVEFVFDKIKVEIASVAGGPLDVVFERSDPDQFSFLPIPAPSQSAATIGAGSGDFAYKFTIAGKTIDLAGYELGFAQPFNLANGSPSGQRTGRPLLIHLKEPVGEGDVNDLFGAAFTNAALGDAKVEVLDADGKTVHTIELTGAMIQAQASANGGGDAQSVFAISYASLDFASFTDPGSALPDVQTTFSTTAGTEDGGLVLVPSTLAEIAPDAQLRPGSTLTLSLANGSGEPIALNGLEFDFARMTTGLFSPLIVHLGDVRGQDGMVRLLTAFNTNANLGTAVIAFKDENDVVVKQVTLTNARIGGQSIAGGGGGSDGAVALLFDSIQFATEPRIAPMTGFDRIVEAAGPLTFETEPLKLGALATVATGAALTSKLEINGLTLDLSGYELDVRRPFDAAGAPTGAATYSPLLVQIKGKAGDADIVALVNAAANNLSQGDATLLVKNADGHVVTRIRLDDVAIGAAALAAGTARNETTLALSYQEIGIERFDGLGGATPSFTTGATLTDAQAADTAFISQAEFSEIARTTQVRTGSKADISIAFKLGSTTTKFDLDGYEFDLFRSPGASFSPLIVQFGGAPGERDLVGLLAAFATSASYDLATIEVKNSGGEVTQSVTLTNPRFAAQVLGAGGGGSDSVAALLYDQITLFAAGTGASTDKTFTANPINFDPTRLKLAGLATQPDGDDFAYFLTFNGNVTPLTGYELDLSRPFGVTGGPSGIAESKPLILHFDESAGNSALVKLLQAGVENAILPTATIEVRNSDNVLVNRIILTNASVEVAAHENGESDGEAALALNYAVLDFENWDGENPAAATPEASARLTANNASETGNVTLVPITVAELAAETNALTPGWIDRVIDEVQDFFEFIRKDAPQRALGLDELPAPFAAAGFSSLAAGDPELPSLSDVPIIGDKLLPAIQNGLDIFRDVEARIIAALNSLPDEEDAAAALADRINGLGIDGLEAEAEGTAVRLVFATEDFVDLALNGIKVSLGTDTFGLDLEADLGARIDAALNASLQIDVATGEVEILDNGVDELSIGLTAGGNFTADAALGFLDITVTDNNPAANEISFDFGLDIAAGRIADLTLDDIDLTLEGGAKLDLHIVTATPVSILPTIAADFVVDWSTSAAPGEGLLREVAFNDVTLDVRAILQTLAEVFKPLGDIFDTFPIDILIDALTTPLPVIDTLARKIGAIPLLDFVPQGTPDGTLNLLDVAVLVLKIQGVPDDDPKIKGISAFAEALAAIESVTGDELDDDFGLIELGSFSFTEPAGSGAVAARASDEGGFAALAAASGSGITQTTPPPTDPFDQLDAAVADSDAYKDGVAGRPGLSVLGGSPFADGFNDISGFSIPLLENAGENAIKILLNAAFPDDPVTIIQYDMPALEFAGGYERFFPIVGPIGAVLRGDFGGRLDLAIGYDTKGLAAGGLSDFAEGFFFTTQEFTPGSGIYEPLAKLEVGIRAGVAINIGVAQAGVFGGIISETSAFLNDGPDNDGKLRLSELDFCLIDPLSGKLTAELSARIKFGVGFFSWTRTFKIADATLFDYSFGCDGATPDEMGGLATLGPDGSVPAGTLQLNVGSRAGLRNSSVPNYRIDDDEHFVIRNAIDENGVAITGALQVGAYTVIETFGADPAIPASIIKARFGADDDSLVIQADVLTPSEIHGDAGDDLLIGGGGVDTLHGDAGEDVLDGGSGDDFLYGGDGEDVLEGRAGADYLHGNDDFDQVTYELSPTGVIFREIAAIGGNSASEGTGGDAQGDTLISIEHIIGSRFNDQFYGNRNAKNMLEGLEGNDILTGGTKDDHMLGGPGADLLFGLAGRDGTSYLTSSGAVQIDLTTGQGRGGDAEGDRLVSMEDVHGTVFGDTLRGSASANLLDGFFGDDLIEGRGGADEVFGREGNDTILALADGDDIDGGSGRDLLSYRNRTAGGVTVNLKTGDGGGSDEIASGGSGIAGFSSIEDLDGTNLVGQNDILGGDRGNNRIRGLAGNDGLFGDDGDDILVGGTGADVMIGGNGRDLADYRDSASRVEVDLTLGQGFTGDAQGDSLASIEDLRGSELPDSLIGDSVNNRIDPGLARFTSIFGPFFDDVVDGRGGLDTLVIDYSRSDTGLGLVGGYDLGSSFGGSLLRLRTPFGFPLDSVTFSDIERLEVIGTFKDDVIYGGGGDDLIITGSGNDTIYGGGKGIYPLFDSGQRLGTMIGSDRILAGDGNDSVSYGTNEFRQLARDIQQSFGPFYLDGGRGIDTLSISLAHLGSDIVIVGSPDGSETLSTNLSFGGSYIANFEILGSVFTGSGRDVITQTGDYNNIFDAGAGEDVITSGLGNDEIFGGTDFSPPFEGPLVIDFTENFGDLLILDYSSLETETGVTGEVFSIFAPQNPDPRLNNFRINVGTYNSEDGYVEFKDIERLEVTGSNQDDLLVGTDNLAQNRFGFFNDGPVPSADSNETLRGADLLLGLGGNDEIVGNNGSDTIEGGDGNDTLIGPDPNRLFTFLGGRAYTDNYIDQTEVDYLTGNDGADLFVLGTEHGFYYGYTPNQRSEPALDEYNADVNDRNRAIITDFNPDDGDRLQLFADATYTVVEVEGSTRLYLNENNGQRQWIAELEQFVGLELDETNVVFADSGAQFAARTAPAAFDEDSVPLITALDKGEPAAALTLATPDWITQNNDPGSLRQMLLGAIGGSAIDAASLTVTLEGNGEAFGTFDGDPFNLGAGLILSSGKVEDLQGPNLEDGALGRENVAEVQFEFVGRADGSDIFRANLTGLGFDLNSITLPDSNSRLGGSGDLYSGFDLDQVMLSRTLVDGFPDQPLDVFDFLAASIVFRPGTYRFTSNLELAGLRNGIIKDPSHFGRADGFQDIGNDIGWNSLGDGGVISFNLTEPVSTEAPLYLYVSEFGGTGETVSGTIRASDQRIGAVADLSTDFGAPGEANDTTTMTFSFAKAAGSTDDTIMFSFVMFSEELPEFSGSAFNDTVTITLNGESLAQLTDGAALTVNNLMAAPLGQFHPDLILNPAGNGPLTDSVRADAYTRTLTFAGALRAQNTITIEVRDTADGTLDTGVLVRAATAGGLGTWTTSGFNEAPVFSDLDGFATFDAGAAAVTLDPTASVFDAELAAIANYGGATLTLSRLGGPDARDIFAAGGAAILSGGDVLVPGAGTPLVGTIVTNAGGVLSILFNANANQIAVNTVITALNYRNSAPPLAEDVNLLWSFSDGNAGAQGLGGALQAIGATTVHVRGNNSAPTATPNAVSVNEDATIANLAALLLSDDTDPDAGDTLTIVAVDTTGTKGSVAFDAVAQTLVYIADDPSFDLLEPTESTTTSFAYTIRDAAGAPSSATVTVTVNGLLNDDDYIYGTPLNDSFTGTGANEKYRGLAGNDIIRGEGGNDRIEGQDGNDVIYGGSGNNLLFGEAGNDTFGNELVSSINRFDGGAGNDTLITRAAPGQVVTVDLVAGTVGGGYYDGSTAFAIENVKNGSTTNAVVYLGNDEANALTGGMLADILRGGGGNDTLIGSSGHDIMEGGLGADTFSGGLGNDVYILRPGEANGDRITDFSGNREKPGDSLELHGFGPGASIAFAGNVATITHAGGVDIFTLNTNNLDPTDYMFV